jgi:hypothetical protein
MACAILTVNVNPEAMCDDFQVLHTPVVGIPPHPREDFSWRWTRFYGTEYGTIEQYRLAHGSPRGTG